MSAPAQASRLVILVPVDDTPASLDAVRTATRLAASLRSTELHFLHVVQPLFVAASSDVVMPVVTGPSIEEAMAKARALVDELVGVARADYGGSVLSHVAVGAAIEEILQLAADVRPDVIVVGSHNKNAAARFVLGSVSEQVVRRAPCSVIVARPAGYDAGVPEIEPPCPDCVATQRATGRGRLWCARHTGHSLRGHLHYEIPASFAVGSTFLQPEG